MQSTVPGKSPFRQAASRVLVALLWPMICSSLAAKPVQRWLGQNDKYSVAVSGDQGVLRLQFAVGGPVIESPVLTIANDDNFAWCKATLSAAGEGVWTAPLDRKAVEALLVGTKVVVTFPKAAKGEDVILTTPVTEVRPLLVDAGPIMAGALPFYSPPAAPRRPDLPVLDAGEKAMEVFVSAAVSWDRRMRAYRYEYAASVSKARALWVDLVTAGRVPWIKETMIADAYASLEARKAEIEQERDAFRHQASDLVQAWNKSHTTGSQPAVTLTFDQTV